jgi:hypothetical protein
MRHPFVPVFLIPAVVLVGGCDPAPQARDEHRANPAPVVVAAPPPAPAAPSPASAEYQGALKARLDGEFAAVVLADGRKTVVPIASLAEDDLHYLTWLAEQKPLSAPGRSNVVVVKGSGVQNARQTITVAKVEGPVETVQLCSPNAIREQIGATCMLYARVHWLDIAGYYADAGTIFKIINDTPPDAPWEDPKYVAGLDTIVTDFKPRPNVHPIPAGADSFAWARAELRRGRPLLAALPREIVQVLPADFLATYPWSGGSVGHQIVVNGFTWNKETNEGTFHVVNSWAELIEFDLNIRYATDGALVFEASLSPVGEVPTKEELAAASEIVQEVTFVKPVGDAKLFAVTTNLGVRKIIAPDEAAARRMVEEK